MGWDAFKGILRAVSWQQWAILALCALAAAVAWFYWDQISQLWDDVHAARLWLRSLGPWGALMFIFINALQIVVAPLPGYATYAAAGFVFGPWWGGLYATVGAALGGWMAATLARLWGRPIVEKLIGRSTLARWESWLHADSLWLWFLAFLGPTGDAPFHLAGLSSLPIWQIILVATLVRGPAMFVAAAVGAGLVDISVTQLGLILLAAGALMVGLHAAGRRAQQRLGFSTANNQEEHTR